MKLSEALRITNAPPAGAGRLRVYLACGFTPLHLSTFLAAHLRGADASRDAEILTGNYGDLAGNLARARERDCDALAVVVEWSDLDARLGLRGLGGWGPKVAEDVGANVRASAARLLQLITEAAARVPVALCLPTLPLPPVSHLPAAEAGAHELSLRLGVQELAARAAEVRGVRVVSPQRLDELSPLAERLDVKSELAAGFPYRLAHAAQVAGLLALLVRPRAPKKGLITDLDDTLWRGILGDDGVANLSWDLDGRSHVHALYQQTLAALAESGVLVGVASKNDPGIVEEALAREDLIVPRERLFPVAVGWGQKSQSVAEILRAWNVGADSVVFVDDSPIELAEVQGVYPEVECLLFPKGDDAAAYELLRRLRDLFGKQELLEEDELRVESLRRAGEARDEAAAEPGRSLEDFLAQAEAEVTFGPAAGEAEARAFELLNKTNQFNANGRRLDPAEFRAALARPGAVASVVSYKDKYGPLGKIAVMLGRVEGPVLRLDSWVMSCRAFSRHVEHQSLNYLFEEWGVDAIEVDYAPTARNGPFREFLTKLTGREPEGACRITREEFASRRPALSHHVNRVSYV